MIKNRIIFATIVFLCFHTNVNAENGHVDLKYLSENLSILGSTQNLSGFGVDVYKKIKKVESVESYVDYIEKSNMQKKLEKKLYRERQEGTNPKIIAKLENSLFLEKEKRNKWIDRRKRLQADPNYGGSEGSKIGVGILLGYKYLNGYAGNDMESYSVKKNSLEIGVRISW